MVPAGWIQWDDQVRTIKGPTIGMLDDLGQGEDSSQWYRNLYITFKGTMMGHTPGYALARLSESVETLA